MLKTVMLRSALIAFACALSVTVHAYAADPKRVDVPAGDLTVALATLAKQSGVELVYQTDQLRGLRTRGVTGNFSPEEAVTKLLEGTKLTLKTDSSGAMLIALPRASSNPETPVPGSDSSRTPSAPQALNNSETPDVGIAKKSGFWDRFRLAQNDPLSQTDSSSTKKTNPSQSSDENSEGRVLDEVVVTGSRLRVRQGLREGPQAVQTYTREQIERSGQPGLAGFLDTLPQMSIRGGDGNISGSLGTTVRLRGLPTGTTLVLVNGRRIVSVSGGQLFANFFDLNLIPAAAIERIEVLPEAASATYGSDAIGGVVNLILRKDFEGAEARISYGAATEGGTDDTSASLAWGHTWDRASLTAIATYQKRSELVGAERELAASDDFRPFGGSDLRSMNCHPGNVFSLTAAPLPGVGATSAGVPATLQGTASQADFVPTAGILNRCTSSAFISNISPGDRSGLMVSGTWNITPQIDGFVEAMLSRVEPKTFFNYALVNTIVPAANPYNPFGTNVRVRYAFADLGRGSFDYDSSFARPLVGLRGRFHEGWEWEVAGWGARSRDKNVRSGVDAARIAAAVNSTDPATALNLFTASPPASSQLLDSLDAPTLDTFLSQTVAASALVRGPLLHLPAGPLATVLGIEYFSDELTFDVPAANLRADGSRRTRAAFGEVRIPVLSAPSASAAERLAVSLAGRYDRYSDRFGSKLTGQAGLEWRPAAGLLLRGNFGDSFRAPSLFQITSPANSFQQSVTDPRRGGQSVTELTTQGGNPDLDPESGEYQSYGVLYATDAIRWMQDFEAAATHWAIELSDQIANPAAQTIVNNESLFPGRVTRGAPPGGTDPFPTVGPITAVSARFVNLARLETRGVDASMSWRNATEHGVFSPSLAATYTYRYRSTLTPDSAARDLVSVADFAGYAPRWKGSATLNWDYRNVSSTITARYVGDYLDYSGLREIGEQWFADFNLSWNVGKALDFGADWLSGTRVSFGVVNLFDEEPQFANAGTFGYDPLQADLRGRFAYGSLEIRW